jgi:hypothetical protein
MLPAGSGTIPCRHCWRTSLRPEPHLSLLASRPPGSAATHPHTAADDGRTAAGRLPSVASSRSSGTGLVGYRFSVRRGGADREQCASRGSAHLLRRDDTRSTPPAPSSPASGRCSTPADQVAPSARAISNSWSAAAHQPAQAGLSGSPLRFWGTLKHRSSRVLPRAAFLAAHRQATSLTQLVGHALRRHRFVARC